MVNIKIFKCCNFYWNFSWSFSVFTYLCIKIYTSNERKYMNIMGLGNANAQILYSFIGYKIVMSYLVYTLVVNLNKMQKIHFV